MSFQVLIDWRKDGFDPENSAQDITDQVMSVTARRGFEPFHLMEDEPEMTLVLNNTDRRFSPEVGVTQSVTGVGFYGGFAQMPQFIVQEAPPYVGQLHPNLPVQLLFDGVPLWTGYTYTWLPDPLRYGTRLARLVCRGIVWLLKSRRIAVDLYTNTTADVVIADAIAKAAITLKGDSLWVLGRPGQSELGVTTYLRASTAIGDFQPGEAVIPFFGFNNQSRDNEQGTSALTIIQDALDHERGRLYTAADGETTFLSRNAWTINGTPDVQAANDFFDLQPLGQLAYLKNVIRVQGYQRLTDGSSDNVLWTLHNPIRLNAGQRRVVEAYITDDAQNIIATDDVQPVAGRDIAWSGVPGTVSVRAHGQSLVMEIVNNGDAPTTLTTLTVRGTHITSTAFTVEARDTASIDIYQEIEETITVKSLDDVSAANDIAAFELTRRLTTASGSVDALTYQRGFDELTAADDLVTMDIGALILVTDDQLGHSRKYRVCGVAHTLDAARREYRVTYTLEPAYTGGVWILGQSLLDQDTILGY